MFKLKYMYLTVYVVPRTQGVPQDSGVVTVVKFVCVRTERPVQLYQEYVCVQQVSAAVIYLVTMVTGLLPLPW